MKTAPKKVLLVEPNFYSREFIKMLLLHDWRTTIGEHVDNCVQAQHFLEQNPNLIDAILISDNFHQTLHWTNKKIFDQSIPILFVGNHRINVKILNCLFQNGYGGYVAKNDLEYSVAQAINLITQKNFVVTPTINKQIQTLYTPKSRPKITNLYKSKEIILLEDKFEQEIIKLFVIYNFSRKMISKKLHMSLSTIGQMISRLYGELNIESYLNRTILFEDELLNFLLEVELKSNKNKGIEKNNNLKQSIAFHILTTLETT